MQQNERVPCEKIQTSYFLNHPTPEAETLFAFECSMEATNLPIFLKFENALF